MGALRPMNSQTTVTRSYVKVGRHRTPKFTDPTTGKEVSGWILHQNIVSFVSWTVVIPKVAVDDPKAQMSAVEKIKAKRLAKQARMLAKREE
mmetsp:Transcript_2749/g.5573  ORF Transcript_2749/g.5573 Transcript_2749/m.5573 type:complete len:92 (-) Transcript_2749:451-726(-)